MPEKKKIRMTIEYFELDQDEKGYPRQRYREEILEVWVMATAEGHNALLEHVKLFVAGNTQTHA